MSLRNIVRAEILGEAVSKRHFNAIARVLADARRTGDPNTVDRIATELANFFNGENERFDTDRFLDAAGRGTEEAAEM